MPELYYNKTWTYKYLESIKKEIRGIGKWTIKLNFQKLVWKDRRIRIRVRMEADPDPCQNAQDPHRWFQGPYFKPWEFTKG